MVWIRGSYKTNHPKDRAARRYVQLKNYIHGYQISKNKMHKPTESNVQDCMKEIQLTSRASKELKSIGKKLGETTNCEDFRR